MTTPGIETHEEPTDTPKRRIAAVIPAAGRGKRFGSPENKIWTQIGGMTVLQRTLAAFASHPDIDLVVIAAGAEEMDRVRETASSVFGSEVTVVAGGATRADSVRRGIEGLPEGVELVLVHDAARPLVRHELIDRVIAAARTTGASVPGTPLSDTVKRADAQGIVRATVPRSAEVDGVTLTGLTAVQTPQGARVDLLRRAYSAFDFSVSEPTDEASLIEALGEPVEIVPGDPDNIKITRPQDVDLAERLLGLSGGPSPANASHAASGYSDAIGAESLPAPGGQPAACPETRTGFGYDVHAFAAPEAGRSLFLGGIEIPHDRGLEGHSDADVLLHAVCDALLGALSLGDIGILFPNTDETYRGISSLKLLAVVAQRVAEKGWHPVNIDATVVAEAPKLMPHRIKMQETIAAALGISADRISVKATTSEKMGFVGRREGMACWAVATLRARS